MIPPLVKRANLTQKTWDKYKAQPMDWVGADCLKMARSHLVGFGHNCPRIPKYNGPISALKALKKAGHDDLKSLFDAMEGLPSIPPAAALIGDLCVMKGDGPLDAIVINMGGGKVYGWHDDDLSELKVILPKEIMGAWSVMP